MYNYRVEILRCAILYIHDDYAMLCVGFCVLRAIVDYLHRGNDQQHYLHRHR